MKVSICSRKDAEALVREGFPKNTAVICFYSPGEEAPDYRGLPARLMTVCVRDIDIETLSWYGMTPETYFPEADAAAQFIRQAERDGLDILCQCDYGQSRSAACCAAIREYFRKDGIRIFADYRYYPNQLIFNKMLEALNRTDGI